MQRIKATGRHSMVGGGIAALSAAVLLMRDGGVPGARLRPAAGLASRQKGLGRLDVFANLPDRTSSISSSVTRASPAFVTFMQDFGGNRTGPAA